MKHPRNAATRRVPTGPGRLAGCLLALCPSLAAVADVDPHGGMLRYPDVSATQVTFVYANDIWVVPREGGQATAVASPPGAELFPRFSPDGKTIAFVGNYDGNRDIYTIPSNGGVPLRVTHHPSAEQFCDWTSDGQLLFSMNGLAGLARQQQLFLVGAEGGMPEQLPVPYGSSGAISADGTWLAYTPYNRDFRTWKRYRGGMASDIWLFNLNTFESKQVTDWEGTDTQPMWLGDTLYYLSDAGDEAKLNVWSYDTQSGSRTQVTRFAEYDVKWPSIGPGPSGRGEIVLQNGSSLYLLDLRTSRSQQLNVIMPGDRPTIRARRVDVSQSIGAAGISSTGKRAVVEARGDLWSLPAENGPTRNLTATSGTFERDPAWSPDGRWIAFFSDASGEYELHVMQSDGKGESRQLTTGSSTFYMQPRWSPDSKHVAYVDKAGNLWLTTVETGETMRLDTDPYAYDFVRPEMSWSHDSRWIAYLKSMDGLTTSLWVYNVPDGSTHQLTSGMFPDGSPAFDRKGDWLYYTSARSFAPTYSDVDTTWIYKDSGVLLAIPLREDVKSPWLAKSDEEEFTEGAAEGEEESGEESPAADESGEDAPAAADDGVSGTWACQMTGPALQGQTVDFTMILSLGADGSLTGSVSSPMGNATISGSYDKATGKVSATVTTDEGESLSMTGTIADGSFTGAVSGGDFAADFTGSRSGGEGDDAPTGDVEARETVEIDFEGIEGRAMELPVPAGNFGNLAVNNQNQLLYVRTSTRGGSGAAEIKLFDINADDKAEKSVASGAGGFDLSSDGKKILIRRGGSMSIQNASAGASGKNIDTSTMKTTIDPRKEWTQVFNDAWRLQRIYFYDATMHGVDWSAVRDRYAAMLDDCMNREDVGYVIGEMIAELNVGHAYYGGGDTESEPSENVGMLGVDFALEDGAYRIMRIYEGAAWDSDARGPLSQPGVDINEGDFLLAVNGVPMDTVMDPWASFVGLAGKTVALTVSENPAGGEEQREVLVETIGSEGNLRYRAWIEANRKYVDEQSGGRVAYVYVPDTGVNGQTNLVRQFVGQRGREALIVDERWNGGGQIPTRFIEMLNRPITNYWARRDQGDWPWPPDAMQGPKCMLINGLAGSGGDAFPYYFRQAGLGKLIGRRTWGGLVGISGAPPLIDGASVTVPTFAFYENDGTWGVEGHGVEPDIEVIDDPAKMVDGGDPQLDAAIELMLQELAEHPYVKPQRPAAPNRRGMGIKDEDK